MNWCNIKQDLKFWTWNYNSKFHRVETICYLYNFSNKRLTRRCRERCRQNNEITLLCCVYLHPNQKKESKEIWRETYFWHFLLIWNNFSILHLIYVDESLYIFYPQICLPVIPRLSFFKHVKIKIFKMFLKLIWSKQSKTLRIISLANYSNLTLYITAWTNQSKCKILARS